MWNPNDPKDREFLAKKFDKTTGKSLLQIMLEASKESGQKMNAILDKNEVKKEFRAGSEDEPKKKKSKYSNQRVEIDGIKFDSLKEASHYRELKFKEKAGLIKELQHHRIFKLVVNGVHICSYEADFVYKERDAYSKWRRVVADVKTAWFLKDTKSASFKLYNQKKKLMFALYGIKIREVT